MVLDDTKNIDGLDTQTKCGFVAIIGAPNVGKSTLTNNLCDAKISIVTPKAQTTRSRIKAITIYENTQLVFVDTPGIFKLEKNLDNRLNRSIVLTARNSFEGVDYLAFVVDARKGLKENDNHIIDLLKNEPNKKILIINKIDLVKKEKLLHLSAEINSKLEFDRTFMVSATKNKYTEDILKYLADSFPASPWMYPEDMISDSPMRIVASEATREKVFLFLQEELPYNAFVETETYDESENSITINQSIFVKTESHKRIVIGHQGSLIKKIGERARQDISRLTGKKVNLYLFVKVRSNWMDNKENYESVGMDFSS